VDLGAAHYVTKYMIKEQHGTGEWDLVDYGENPSDYDRMRMGWTMNGHRLE